MSTLSTTIYNFWIDLYYLEETSLSEKWLENLIIWGVSSIWIHFSLKSLYNEKTLTKQMKNKRFLKTSGKTMKNEYFLSSFEISYLEMRMSKGLSGWILGKFRVHVSIFSVIHAIRTWIGVRSKGKIVRNKFHASKEVLKQKIKISSLWSPNIDVNQYLGCWKYLKKLQSYISDF